MSMSDVRLNYFCLVGLRLFVVHILCIGLILLINVFISLYQIIVYKVCLSGGGGGEAR